MKDWIPVISALLGFVAGIAGTWLTQRANQQLEEVKQKAARKLEADKWEREQTRTKIAEQKQLFIDIVEYVEERAEWLRSLEWFSNAEREKAKLNLHPSQLAGRVKMSAPYWVSTAWDDFDRALASTEGDLALGNYQPHEDLPGIMELEDRFLVPRALVAGEILVASVRAEHGEEKFSDLVDDLLDRLGFQTDNRSYDAAKAWKDYAEVKNGHWSGSLTGSSKAIYLPETSPSGD